MIRLDIPRVPTSPNYLLGKHWRYRWRNSQVWQQEIRAALLQNGYSTQRIPYPKARVSINRRSQGQLDPDNLVGSVKPIMDALRYAHVLADDSPDHIELVVTQTRSPGLKPRTLIEIQPLEAV